MRVFSRALARWEMLRVAATTLALAWLLMFGALIYVLTASSPDLSVVLGAVAALAIGAAGILYAWREPGA